MKNLFETDSENSVQVDRIARTARALRGLEQIVEAKRGQSQSITKMQIQTMDHMMGAWEEQMKLPIAKTISPSALLSELKSYCRSLSRLAVGQTGRLFLQFWMQFTEQWRRAGADAMTSWAKTGKPPESIERHSQ
jgi:hypothetical protein